MTEKLTEIIEALNYVYEKPGLWIGVNAGSVMIHFIQGFSLSCAVIGVYLGDQHRNDKIGDNIFETVVRERGWEYSAQPVYHQMHERGYETYKIAQEVVAIEIEVLKRRYNIEEKVS
jgi:hypothetical protein